MTDKAEDDGCTEAQAYAALRKTVFTNFVSAAVKALPSDVGAQVASIPVHFVSAHAWKRTGEPRYEERKVLDFMATAAASRSPAAIDIEALWAALCASVRSTAASKAAGGASSSSAGTPGVGAGGASSATGTT